MSRRRQAVLLLFSLGCFALFCSAFGVRDWFRLTCSLLASFPCSGRPLGLFSGASWSSQCSAGPSLWVSGCICDGPVVMLGMVCCDGLAPFFTLFTASTRCCVCCFGAPPSCTEVFTIGVIQIPLRTPLELHAPLSLARAAPPSCSCCLPRRPLSCCCWPPPAAFSLVLFVRWLPSPVSLPLCVLVCCFCPLLWPFVVVGFVFVWCFWSGLSLLFVWFVWFAGCACCQLAKVTKDYQGLPTQHHTHTHPSQCFPASRHSWGFVSVFVIWPFSVVLAALSPHPTDLFRTV